MPPPRLRAFIVVDFEEFDGTAEDLANMVEAHLQPHDVAVYATLEDMLHDRAAQLDIFEHQAPPIPLTH